MIGTYEKKRPMHLDIPTLYALGIGTLGVAIAMTLWERRAHPRRADVLGLWAAAYATLVLGCIALIARSAFPGVWGQTLIGVLVVAGHLLVLQGVRRLDGPTSIGPVLAGSALVAVMWLTLGAYQTAAVWHYIGFVPNALVHAAITRNLLRSAAIRELPSRPMVAGLFLGHTVFCVLHFTLAPALAAWIGPAFMPVLSAVTMVEGLLYSVAVPAGLTALVREEAGHRLKAVSQTDYLTGLGSRQAFFETGARHLACASGPTALLAFDLDHFKAINDRHGHAAGDAVLRHFAGLAREVLGHRALLARIGGEEFAALLPATDTTEARGCAETLRQRFAAQPAGEAGVAIPATVSIGLARCEPGESDLARLLSEADRALYAAKSLGRNRLAESDAASAGGARQAV